MNSVYTTSISNTNDNILSPNSNKSLKSKTPTANSRKISTSKSPTVKDIDEEEQLLGQNLSLNNNISVNDGEIQYNNDNQGNIKLDHGSSASVASSSYTITPSTTSKYYKTQRRGNYSSQYIYGNNTSGSRTSLNFSSQQNVYDDSTSYFEEWSSFQSLNEFLKRLMDYQQMDFEAAFDDMITLISTKPDQVYVMAKYRKHTKSHWARDDPAFAAIQIFFLLVSSISYTITFRSISITSLVYVLLRTIFLEWLLAGIIMATLLRYVANKYLRVHNRTHSVVQNVEWRYAFDIHCNSFFVFFLFTYILQFFFLPLLDNRSLTAMIFANGFYVIACTCYFYITHLGYRALPFLTKTEVYFYPTVLSFLMFIIFFLLGLLGEKYRFNLTSILTRFFFAD